MNNKNILLVCFALALAGMACQSSVLGVPVTINTPTSIASALTQTAPPTSPAPALSQEATKPASVVCFQGIENGMLRVRECPGLGCREVSVLISGDPVAVTGERKVVDGSTWLRIDAPLAGWVNARYVCEAVE